MKLMKYITLVFAFFIMISFPVNKVSAESKKINVYIFRGEGCSHCKEALAFFDELGSDEEYSKYYNLVKKEVWYNENNAKIMEKVAKSFNEQANGVPYIVIGKKTFSGYASSYNDDIKKAIKTAYNDKGYKDYVAKYYSTAKESKTSPIIPILIVTGVTLLIVGGIVFLVKKI